MPSYHETAAPAFGFEVLARFPRKKRSFPIVMLTNFENAESRQKAEKLGADGYLVKKDITLKTLVESVRQLLPHDTP